LKKTISENELSFIQNADEVETADMNQYYVIPQLYLAKSIQRAAKSSQIQTRTLNWLTGLIAVLTIVMVILTIIML